MLQLNIWRLKIAIWFFQCCYIIADNALRAIRFPARLSMVITVPTLFAASWFGYDPVLRLYAWYAHPPPVVVYDPPPSAPPSRLWVTPLPPSTAAPVVIGSPARDTSRQYLGHVANGEPIDDDRKRRQQTPKPTPAGFFPLEQYPDPDAPTAGGFH